jgi:plasmid stability protein
MPNLSIKDVPESLAEALRQRAARNHRSLQGELMSIIERAASDSCESTAATSPSITQTSRDAIMGYGDAGRPIIRRGWKSVEEVAASLRERFPNGAPGANEAPLGVDIIRAERDSR